MEVLPVVMWCYLKLYAQCRGRTVSAIFNMLELVFSADADSKLFVSEFSAHISIKVSATLQSAIFRNLGFLHSQIDLFKSFLLQKTNQKKILFLSKDIGGKRFCLVNYLN